MGGNPAGRHGEGGVLLRGNDTGIGNDGRCTGDYSPGEVEGTTLHASAA
mgnify:CR=1 FL=1